MNYQPTIGLEIHIELNTKSKMFCSCLNDPDEHKPNINICPICTAQPGTLPVINGEAMKKVIKTGLSLNCQISEFSKFDRKNYFYPDLPKGYQISQLYNPLCKNGYLELKETEFPVRNSVSRRIRIKEIHLEEDTGRLAHSEDENFSAGKKNYSLVDFNRAGVPLMELVTEPDIASAKEARQFAQDLHLIMRYLNVSDANMEKGQMRVEVNISLSPKFKIQNPKLGTKIEIKNLNSFRAVERGIDYEIQRQAELLDKGVKIVQETRGWDDINSATFSQREKEEANDYRYFPEPDLPPLRFTEDFINSIQLEIPELPQQKKERFIKNYGLDEKSVEIYVYDKNLGEKFEKYAKELPPNLVSSGSAFLINTEAKNYDIPPKNFLQMIVLINNGKISRITAKEILPEIAVKQPLEIIKERGLGQLSEKGDLEKIIKEVIVKNPKAVKDYKSGKANALQFLAGQAIAASKGKANPSLINKLLIECLN